MLTFVFLTSVACVLLCMSLLLVSHLECKSVRSKVVSIDKSQFDRRLQLLLKCIELTIYQICLRIFLEPGLQWTANSSVSIELFCCGIILLPRSGTPRKKPRQQKRSIENCVSSSHILHRAIITQHKNFYYYLYACKAVVFIIIYSSIELTFDFDRNDHRSNCLAMNNYRIELHHRTP